MDKVTLSLQHMCLKDVLDNGTFTCEPEHGAFEAVSAEKVKMSAHRETLDAILAKNPEQIGHIHKWCLDGANVDSLSEDSQSRKM